MINIDNYSKFLSDQFKTSLADDISISIHDEFYYNDKADLNVTIKVLPGDIQCGVVQYPVELLIEVDERFYDEVATFLHEFAFEHNETLITLGGHTFKQFYATPNVMGTFQDKGIVRNTAISMSVSLISYNNVLGLDTVTLTSVSSGASCIIKEPPNFVASYLVNTNATGSVSDQHSRAVGETVATAYSISMVPTAEAIFVELLILMLEKALPNSRFDLSLKFKNGESEILATIDVKAIIQSGSYSQKPNGLPLMELTFTRGEEN